MLGNPKLLYVSKNNDEKLWNKHIAQVKQKINKKRQH